MGLLGISAFGGILARLGAEVISPVFLFHTGPGRCNRLITQLHRIGAHVGDITALIKPLGRAHCFAGRKAQLAVCLLLQGAGGEWWGRLAQGGFFLHLSHPPNLRSNRFEQALGVAFSEQSHLGAGLDGTGVFIEISTGGNAFAGQLVQLCLELHTPLLQLGL